MRSSILPVLITYLSFALRIYRLDHQSLWWDELYTVASAAMTVPEMMDNLLVDRVHLPLYFMLLQGWSEIGRGEFVIRYFSVLCGVLSLPLIYQTGRLLAGRPVGWLAAFLLAIAPFHVWYSQEARMYTFLMLNALAANYFLLRLFRHQCPRYWIGYSMTLTFTLYSHYLGALLLIAHYVFFSLHYRHDKTQFRRWFISASVAGAAFMAWFLTVFFVSSFRQASISWIDPVRWYEPVVTLLAFAVGRTIDPARPFFYLGFLAYLVPAMAMVGYVRRALFLTYDHWAARLLWAWLLVPLVLMTLVSLDWSIADQRFVYMDRYIISLLPAFVLLTAWGAVTLARQRWANNWLLPTLLLLVSLPTIASLRNLYFDPKYGREDWRQAVAHIAAHKQEGDILLLTPVQILPLAYYEDAQLPQVVLPDVEGMAEVMTAVAQDYERVWLLRSFDNADTHGFPQTRNEAVLIASPNKYEAWLAAQYSPVGQWTFTGIRLAAYEMRVKPLTYGGLGVE